MYNQRLVKLSGSNSMVGMLTMLSNGIHRDMNTRKVKPLPCLVQQIVILQQNSKTKIYIDSFQVAA